MQEDVEIIFVSSDNSQSDMMAYMKESHGDWFGVEHGSGLGQDLSKQFSVNGIPTLVVLKADGTVVSKDGTNTVRNKGPEEVLKKWKREKRKCIIA